jgi:hypothetical protein
MKPQKAWQLGLVAVVLAGAGTLSAAFQGQDTVCWLGTGDWQLREEEGNLCLVECHWSRTEKLPMEKRYEWYVSAPTIKSRSGKYLAGDPEGHEHTVYLAAANGANTRWVFEIVSTFVPEPSEKRADRGVKKGPSGFAFRVKMAEGRLKGWYLAAEELTMEQKERKGDGLATRRLKLVSEVKEATVFTYIEDNYYVAHG